MTRPASSDTARAAGRERRFPSPLGLALGLVCLAAILPYLATLRGYFLGDDFGYVQLFARKPPLHFLSLFTASWAENIWGMTIDEIRPFPALVYQLDALWNAASPLAFHVTNILVHLLTTLAVFALARTVARLPLRSATVAAVLFAVLPIHAETVAWITGRVDSLPTLFYLGALLAYARWRRTAAGGWYGASVGLAFVALFCKQSALTILATLAFYDLLVERRPLRLTVSALRAYVPFALLTLCYLGLRWVLFGNAVREDKLSLGALGQAAILQFKYLLMIASGTLVFDRQHLGSVLLSLAPALPCIAVLGAIGGSRLRRFRTASPEERDTSRRLLYFGPVWWIVGFAPLTVAGYFAPRHLYLAATGLAVGMGIVHHLLASSRRCRWGATLGGAALVLLYVVRLELALTSWQAGGALSATMLRDLQREAARAPAGTLFLLGAPESRRDAFATTPVWSWALPFALQPPFSREDLTRRAVFVGPKSLYARERQWFGETRHALQTWLARTDQPPMIALDWDPATGRLMRLPERESARLRRRVANLAASNTEAEMITLMDETLCEIAAPAADRISRGGAALP